MISCQRKWKREEKKEEGRKEEEEGIWIERACYYTNLPFPSSPFFFFSFFRVSSLLFIQKKERERGWFSRSLSLSFLYLEDSEDLLDVEGGVGGGEVLDHVESDRLGQRSALAHGHNVAFLHVLEAGGAVDGHVLVSLLITLVLGDEVEVIPSHDDRSLHLGGKNEALQDSTSNGHVAGEGALLVDVATLNSGLGSLESKADVLVISGSLCAKKAKKEGKVRKRKGKERGGQEKRPF